MLRLGVEPHPAGAHRLERRLLQLVHRAPPLRRDQRLDPVLAAVAERDGMPVRLALLELVALAEPGEDAFLGLLLRQALEPAGLPRHATVPTHHPPLPAS